MSSGADTKKMDALWEKHPFCKIIISFPKGGGE